MFFICKLDVFSLRSFVSMCIQYDQSYIEGSRWRIIILREKKKLAKYWKPDQYNTSIDIWKFCYFVNLSNGRNCKGNQFFRNQFWIRHTPTDWIYRKLAFWMQSQFYEAIQWYCINQVWNPFSFASGFLFDSIKWMQCS